MVLPPQRLPPHSSAPAEKTGGSPERGHGRTDRNPSRARRVGNQHHLAHARGRASPVENPSARSSVSRSSNPPDHTQCPRRHTRRQHRTADQQAQPHHGAATLLGPGAVAFRRGVVRADLDHGAHLLRGIDHRQRLCAPRSRQSLAAFCKAAPPQRRLPAQPIIPTLATRAHASGWRAAVQRLLLPRSRCQPQQWLAAQHDPWIPRARLARRVEGRSRKDPRARRTGLHRPSPSVPQPKEREESRDSLGKKTSSKREL